MWKLEFWKLEIKFGNQNFEELIWEWEFKKEIKFQDWNFENWKLNLEIRILKNYLRTVFWKTKFWRLESWEIILRMKFREIKEIEILKIYYENGISKN